MKSTDCFAFLQWALPQLSLRWYGFRKVRNQVCKRIRRRMETLGLEDFAVYQDHLERHPEEWAILDGFCRITISRFYRDRNVFRVLGERVLPQLAQRAAQEKRDVACWSAGCASGEEVYTLRILWDLTLADSSPRCCPFAAWYRCRRSRSRPRVCRLLPEGQHEGNAERLD